MSDLLALSHQQFSIQTYREVGELLEVTEEELGELAGDINIDDEGEDEPYMTGNDDSDEYDLHDELWVFDAWQFHVLRVGLYR